MRPYRVSAMHAAHVALGAKCRDEADWRVVDAYGLPADEAVQARAGIGLVDTSACGKLALRGDGIDLLLAKAVGVERLPAGAAERLRVNGARTLACRLADDEFLLLTHLAETPGIADLLRQAAGGNVCAHLTDVTSGLAALDLVGPRVRELLARLSPLDLAAVPALGIRQGELAGVHAVLVRLDRPDGFRALVAREYGAFVWETLAATGADLGLTPIGAAARAMLEAG
jgi:heterotetrameric sarcosine oxidase gamma subunit